MAEPVRVAINVEEKFASSTVYNVTINSRLGQTNVDGKGYSDYEAIHMSLNSKHGSVIPPLPPKKAPGDKKARHQQIKSGFETFLNTVLSRPETAGEPELCRFLSLDPATTTSPFVQQAPPPAQAPAPAPATPQTQADQPTEGIPAASPPMPAGLEGYIKTDAPPMPSGFDGYNNVSAESPSPAPAPAPPLDVAFSPTPLPAAMTPEATPNPFSPPPAAQSDPTPIPSPATPALPSRTLATRPPAAAALATNGSKVGDREKTLAPGAREGDYSGSDEDICRAWIKELSGQECGEGSLQEGLKSGVVLCNLVNKIQPGTIKKVQISAMPFPQRENIAAFCEAARDMGVPDRDNFTTQDLFEDRNMRQVCLCIMSLSRRCYWVDGFKGPCIGKPEMAKQGGAKESKFGEIKTEGLWGKANGAFSVADGRPVGSPADSKSKFSSAMRP